MKFVYEASAKSVDEAIDIACMEAGVDLSEAEIEVLELGSKGLWGIGAKNAKVRLTVERPDSEAATRPAVTTLSAPVKEEAEPAAPAEEVREHEPRRRDNRRRDRHERRHAEQEAKETAHAPKREPRPVVPCDPVKGQAAAERSLEFLALIFAKLKVEPQSTIEYKEEIVQITFSGENLGALIGRRGETLNALQYLVNLAANKAGDEHIRLVLDVEGYRQSREETLMNLARKMADKAVRTGRRVELEPMSPHERRVVHLALQDDNRVETLSRGEEPYRRVVISSKKRPRRK